MIAGAERHRSLAFRIGRPLVEGRLEVTGDRREQLATRREFTLPAGNEVLEATGECFGVCIAANLHTYARRVGYLESVLKVISAVGGDWYLKLTSLSFGARDAELSAKRRRFVGGLGRRPARRDRQERDYGRVRPWISALRRRLHVVAPGWRTPMPSQPPLCERIATLIPTRRPGGVDQRAARVPGIDRRVGLNEVLDAGSSPLRTIGADDALRHRLADSERIAHRAARRRHATRRSYRRDAIDWHAAPIRRS